MQDTLIFFIVFNCIWHYDVNTFWTKIRQINFFKLAFEYIVFYKLVLMTLSIGEYISIILLYVSDLVIVDIIFYFQYRWP